MTEIISLVERKQRGRPKGEWRGPSLRYRPKSWRVEFSQLVIDSVIIPGVTQLELGKKYNYTQTQINNILNSPQTAVIKEQMARGILKENINNIVVKMGEISKKAVERMHDFMHDDKLYSNSPFAFIDKTLAIGKSIGSLKSEGSGNSTVNNTQVNILSPEQSKALGDSISLALELKNKPIEKVQEVRVG